MTALHDLTTSGDPVGLQVIAAEWNDAMALRVGQANEARTSWHDRTPPSLV